VWRSRNLVKPVAAKLYYLRVSNDLLSLLALICSTSQQVTRFLTSNDHSIPIIDCISIHRIHSSLCSSTSSHSCSLKTSSKGISK
jgi:hypothetical protein